MKPNARLIAIFVVILLYVPIVLMQAWIDPRRHEFEPKNDQIGTIGKALPIEFTLVAAAGFREAIAGLLWVRTDKFFHEGNYDAIVPMVRIITWLDPHNVDVYQTGAWHLDYNFTDNEQRSDRRYLPLSVALLEEGIQANPTITKLYADLAFTHYFRKMCNYERAIYWYRKAQDVKETDSKQPYSTDPDTGKRDQYVIDPILGKPRPLADPTIVGHGLAHALQANGDIDGAIVQWQHCIDEHKRLIIESPETKYQDESGLRVAERNLFETIERKKFRTVDTQPPINLDFDAWVVRTAPRQFRFEGRANFIGATAFKLEGHQVTWGPVDGARIAYRLEDDGYQQPKELPFELNVALPKNVTIMQDSASVTHGKFSRRANLDQDSHGDNPMYPFKAERYKLTFWFDPRDPASSPPNLGDRIGWLGEGLTDSKYLDLSGKVPGSLQGPDEKANVRLIKKVIYLTRDDIMGTGEKKFE
ncbi:MAG: hypothetical protein P4L33_04630 [Capsulimonadaceae bacterium]|nr:hypothetical protein [Capsulimonadaceae bacterium]